MREYVTSFSHPKAYLRKATTCYGNQWQDPERREALPEACLCLAILWRAAVDFKRDSKTVAGDTPESKLRIKREAERWLFCNGDHEFSAKWCAQACGIREKAWEAYRERIICFLASNYPPHAFDTED